MARRATVENEPEPEYGEAPAELEGLRNFVVLRERDDGKGRSFSAVCVASVECDGLARLGASDDSRPVFAAFAQSDDVLRPFLANVRAGKKIECDDRSGRRANKGRRMEFMRSAEYECAVQKTPAGTVATLWLPELFQVDPGMVDPSGARFILLPERRWAEEQRVPRSEMLAHVARLAQTYEQFRRVVVEPHDCEIAYLFAAYLDRRTRCPIVADGRFYLQLMLAALDEGMASRSGADQRYAYSERSWGKTFAGFVEVGTSNLGLLPAVAFTATHESIETLLAEQIDRYFYVGGV